MRDAVIKVVDSRALPAVVLAAIACLYLSTVSGRLGDYSGDTAYYMLLGRSIAQGDIYTDPVMPGEYPHTKYPFFYPLLLSPVIAITGLNMLWIRAFVALLAALSAAAWYAYFREAAGGRVALSLTVLFAFHPYSVSFVTRTLSETPYLLFTGLCLWMYERWKVQDKGGTFSAVIALAVVSYFTRTAGLALFAGIVLAMVFASSTRTRKVPAMPAWTLALVVFGAAFFCWSAYVFLNPTPLATYFEEMWAKVHPGDGFDVAGYADRVFDNIGFYLGQMTERLFIFLPASALAGVLVFGLIVAGAVKGAGEGRLVPLLYAVFYIVMILLWPTFVDFRFIYPLFPLFLLFGYWSLQWLGGYLKKAGEVLPAAVFVVLFLLYAYQTGRVVYAQHQPDPYPDVPVMMYGHEIKEPVVDWSDTFYAYKTASNMFAVGEFLVLNRIAEKELPSDAVIACDKPSNTTLLTGRNAVRSPASPSPRESLEYLESWEVSHVIVDRFSENTAQCVVPLLRSSPQHFEKLFGKKGALAPAIYRFRARQKPRY